MKSTASKNGKIGEDSAEKFLLNKGYETLKRNYHSRYGEIDIISRIDNYLVFTEVKARSFKTIAQPKEWVDYKKQEKIVKTAACFLEENELDLQPRFDVIEAFISSSGEAKRINHIENAFDSMI